MKRQLIQILAFYLPSGVAIAALIAIASSILINYDAVYIETSQHARVAVMSHRFGDCSQLSGPLELLVKMARSSLPEHDMNGHDVSASHRLLLAQPTLAIAEAHGWP